MDNKGLNGVTHSAPHHPSTLQHTSLPFLNSGQLTPRLAGQGTVSLMCYCVYKGAKPPDSVGYSEGQAEKQLGSLASCWGSEPWPAWSVKPCQMEPFQNNESCFAMVEDYRLVVRGTQRVGIYLQYMMWWLGLPYIEIFFGQAAFFLQKFCLLSYSWSSDRKCTCNVKIMSTNFPLSTLYI